MPRIRMEILNEHEVREALMRLPADIESKAEQAVAESVDAVESSAKSNVPVDSGDLRDSIVGTYSGLSGVVEVGEHYGWWVEFGTTSSSYPEQPFLNPAAEEERDRFVKRIGDVMQDLK